MCVCVTHRVVLREVSSPHQAQTVVCCMLEKIDELRIHTCVLSIETIGNSLQTHTDTHTQDPIMYVCVSEYIYIMIVYRLPDKQAIFYVCRTTTARLFCYYFVVFSLCVYFPSVFIV